MRKALVVMLALFALSAVAQNTGKIFAVRHAEKQSSDKDTPLSDLGKARADCLAKTLKDAHITTIFTTTNEADGRTDGAGNKRETHVARGQRE